MRKHAPAQHLLGPAVADHAVERAADGNLHAPYVTHDQHEHAGGALAAADAPVVVRVRREAFGITPPNRRHGDHAKLCAGSFLRGTNRRTNRCDVALREISRFVRDGSQPGRRAQSFRCQEHLLLLLTLDDNGRWVKSQSRCSMQRSGAEKDGKRESCSDKKLTCPANRFLYAEKRRRCTTLQCSCRALQCLLLRMIGICPPRPSHCGRTHAGRNARPRCDECESACASGHP
mmetsp:Transcript_18548/g.37786  ORF Transcript_18548/g.37786 Transcript_18548/m.37786 type:complete len:232 (+) Transcript_18548:157-852(+)